MSSLPPEPVNKVPSRALIVGITVAYVAGYVLLDWVSYIHPIQPYAITPWNPPPGLSLALLLSFGLRFAPALLVASITAEIIVRGPAASPVELVAYGVILAGGYTAVAAALLNTLKFSPGFTSLRDLWIFTSTVALGAMGIAACYVAAHVLAGRFPWQDFTSHTLRFWVGDVIGIFITAPFLLVYGRRLACLTRPRINFEALLQAASIFAILFIIFRVEQQAASKFFYLLFLPLIWISMRHGYAGAIAALLLIQVGLIIAVQTAGYAAASVVDLQLLMLALAVTGAFLGMAATQWRHVHDALERRDSELRMIFSTAPDAILSIDSENRIVAVNRTGESIFGSPESHLAGLPLTRLISGLPASLAAAGTIEAQATRADGTRFPVEVSIGSTGEAARTVYIGIVRDMSSRKEMEDRLRERERELDQTMRAAAAAEMASALAHELNQPLTAALNYVQACNLMLRGQTESEGKLQETMSKALIEVERAGEVVRRLRDFYRGGGGRMQTTRVDDLISAALRPLRVRLDRHRINLDTSVEPGLSAVLVDHVQIEMVLYNLVANAIDSIVAGDSDLRNISIDASPADSGFVRIAVVDSGPGVAPSIAEQLFKTFATSKPAGMGLGLAISRSIVENHGGHLWLEQRDCGAEFVLTLPAARAERYGNDC